MDPRPDLPDAWLWGPLLDAARAREGEGVYGVLHGLHCWGAGVERDGTGFCLVPGEMATSEYVGERGRGLMPHVDVLQGRHRGGMALVPTVSTDELVALGVISRRQCVADRPFT